MAHTWDAHVAEYVDSPSMVHRIKVGSIVAARIHGTLGTYRVQVDTKPKKGGDCTCPSEIQPCKHVEALRQTWKKKPGSFADVDELLALALKGRTRADLVQMRRSMALASPSSLSALGAVGFDEVAPWDEEDPEGYFEE